MLRNSLHGLYAQGDHLSGMKSKPPFQWILRMGQLSLTTNNCGLKSKTSVGRLSRSCLETAWSWFIKQRRSESLKLHEEAISNRFRHLKTTGVVHEATEEGKLMALCLQYLTFDCFAPQINTRDLQSYAMQGYFAFQDYASAKWFHHLQAMVKLGSKIKCDDALAEIERALEEFTTAYDEVISARAPVTEASTACEAFKDSPFFEMILSLWSHVYMHEKKTDERNNISIKPLQEALVRNRDLLEKMQTGVLKQSCAVKGPKEGPYVSEVELDESGNEIVPEYYPPHLMDQLEAYYGKNLFKCPKLTCFYYHEGFSESTSRKQHIARHERPCSCTVPDCLSAQTGFTTSKDLDKHMRDFHPDVEHQANTFPTTARVAKAPAKWICPMCDKAFTRNFHLKSHILSHNGERPHECPECGKSFTRLNDRKRHQKLHAKGK